MATLSNSEVGAYYRNDSLKSVKNDTSVFVRFGQDLGVGCGYSQVAEEEEILGGEENIYTWVAKPGQLGASRVD